MIERTVFAPENVISVGNTERRGEIVHRDIVLSYKGKTYLLSVGTQDYLDWIKIYNQRFEADMKIDENVLVLERVENMDGIVARLREMDLDSVSPYLVEQKEEQ